MSYEGYTQYLCANHHDFIVDLYEIGPVVCSICGARPIWFNEVDQTNGCNHPPGLNFGEYQCCPITLEVEKEAIFHKCSECGHTRIISETTYKVPPLGVGRKVGCHAHRDGSCDWASCPQLLDGEPANSGRHCPLPHWADQGDM